MISKNDILNFVKHVHNRGRGIPDRRPMHPRREWLIGLILSLIAIAGGVFVSIKTFETYKNVDQRAYTVDIQIPSYDQEAASAVLQDYTKRESDYFNLINQVDAVPEVNDTEITLASTSWSWQLSTLNPEETLTPADPVQFILIFNEDESFSATTDCNTLTGSYVVDGEILSIGPIAATKKACEGETLEQQFAEQLSQASSFVIEEEGLTINLYKDVGVMKFVRK